MFQKPITVNYPDEKVPMFPKYRGKQVLMRDENGLEKCVACGLCAVACPADAIYLEAAENDGTVMAGPRYASVYQIHKTRCIFCGYCEEACPVSAHLHGQGLRARRLQQGRLRLGQDRAAGAGPAWRRGIGRLRDAGCLGTSAAIVRRADRRGSATSTAKSAIHDTRNGNHAASGRAVLDVRRRRGHRSTAIYLGHAGAPVYWIKGNNEDFDASRRARRGADSANLHFIPNGWPRRRIWRVAAFGRHRRAEPALHPQRRCRRRVPLQALGSARPPTTSAATSCARKWRKRRSFARRSRLMTHERRDRVADARSAEAFWTRKPSIVRPVETLAAVTCRPRPRFAESAEALRPSPPLSAPSPSSLLIDAATQGRW